MAIRAIKGIEIYPPIEDLGEIHNFDFNVSDGDRSSLHLNFINEKGVYPLDKLNFGYLTPYKITLFGEIVFYMYLTKYSEKITANRKSLSLELVDGSHILDRVQVVLMDLHMPSNDDLGNVKPSIVEYMSTQSKKIVCESCDLRYTKFIAIKTKRKKLKSSVGYPLFDDPVKGRYYEKTIPAIQGENVVGDNINGGFILVGTEKYSEDACGIPEIIYNLTDLKIAAKRIGITIDIPDFFPGFTSSTTGSLRTCISNFCSQFSFSPSYDIFKREPTIGFVDLKKPDLYEKVKKIKEDAKNFKSIDKNEPIVSSITDSEDMSSTNKAFISMNARIAGGTSEPTVKNVNYLTYYKAAKLAHFFKQKGDSMGGRTDSQVMISSYLAKASPIHRILYNLSLREKDLTAEDALYVCGFNVMVQCNKEDNINILGKGYGFVDEKIKQALIELGAKNTQTGEEFYEAFDLYIGDYNKGLESDWLNWELGVHEFLGKYYINNVKDTSEVGQVVDSLGEQKRKFCKDPYHSVELTAELNPPGVICHKQKYSDPCKKDFPYKQIFDTPGADDRLDEDFFPGKAIRVYTRGDATYSQTPSFIGKLLTTRYVRPKGLNPDGSPYVGSGQGLKPDGTRYEGFSISASCENFTENEMEYRDTQGASNIAETLKPHWLPIETHALMSIREAIRGTALENVKWRNSTLTLSQVLEAKAENHPAFKDFHPHFGLVPSVQTIKNAFLVSKMYEADNDKENDIAARAAQDFFADHYCPTNICSENDEDKPLSPENPCACVAESVINYGYVSNPQRKSHHPGPALYRKYAAFHITLAPIHGILSGLSIRIAFPYGSRPAKLDPTFVPVTTTFNPLGLMPPARQAARLNKLKWGALGYGDYSETLIPDDEYWRANYSEKITKKEFHVGFSRVLNNFAPPGNVSSMNLTHDDVSPDVIKDLTGGTNSPDSIPLNLSDFNSGTFMSLLDYFEKTKILSDTGSPYPKKTLQISLLGSDFGFFKSFISVDSGLKTVRISNEGDEGVKMDLVFENRAPIVPTFSSLFKQHIMVENSQKGS